MADELILNHEDLSNLHRHYINLTCVDSGEHAKASNGGKPKRYNFSAFVVDVEGVLLAITVGHVFEELRKAVAPGSILSEGAIDDLMVSDHGFPAYPVAMRSSGVRVAQRIRPNCLSAMNSPRASAIASASAWPYCSCSARPVVCGPAKACGPDRRRGRPAARLRSVRPRSCSRTPRPEVRERGCGGCCSPLGLAGIGGRRAPVL